MRLLKNRKEDSVGFIGFDKNGEALYDTKDAAIERALMMAKFRNFKGKILIQRNVPMWFAHLVKGTIFEKLGYRCLNLNEQKGKLA
jgi:hypothetical protein